MKILVVSQYFWPESFRINAIVESLAARDIEIDVLTGKPNYPQGKIFPGYRAWGCQQEFWKGAALYRVPLWPRGKGSKLGLVANYLSFIFMGSLAGPWLLRRRQYDVIFVYGLSPIMLAIPAILIAWLKSKKVVIFIQDLWPESLSATGHVGNKGILFFVRLLVRFIYQHADLLLVQSRAFEAQVRELAGNTPIQYYPNSVEDVFTRSVADDMAPQITGLEANRFSVVFTGNIGAAQAVGVIALAASLLREYADIHFVIVGDGSARQTLLDEIQQKGLNNLHVPGRFPLEIMPSVMQRASVLLVTLADRPIFSATIPSKIQVYLAAGRPILASLNGEGAKLITEAGAGLAVPAEDAVALAEAVLSLYRMSQQERDEMGRCGREYAVQHFSHDRLMDQLIGHLQSVCSLKEKSE